MARKPLSKEQLQAIHAKIEKLKNSKEGVTAYDVKAKMKARMENPVEVRLKNGRIALQGTSVKSGNKITRIVG